MKFSHRQSNKIEFYLISLRKFHWKWTWIELWNITKYIWKHKRHICYTHNHKNLMKQSRCLSLILCQKYTVKKQSFFPTVSQKLQANQPFANNLHTIYRMCEEEIEHPMVGDLLESLQNGDGEPTISYRCSATNMTFGLGDRLPSFATWIEANLEKKHFKCHLWCQNTKV